MYDFDGRLLRCINREYEAVSLTDEDKERYEQNLQRYPPEIRGSFFVPDVFPPFRNIVALGDEWLFVQIYEEPQEARSIYDVFDTKGGFTGRIELEGFQVKFKENRAYCLKQKESRYKEPVVYRMKWD